MSWMLTSEDRMVLLDLDASDNGPLNGTLTVANVRYPVRGSWAASFSVPGRKFSAFSLCGDDQVAAPTFLTAAGTMTGPGASPEQIDIRISLSSSTDGSTRRYEGTLYPATSTIPSNIRRSYFFIRNPLSGRVLTAVGTQAAGNVVMAELDQQSPVSDKQLWALTPGGAFLSLGLNREVTVAPFQAGMQATLVTRSANVDNGLWSLEGDGSLKITKGGSALVLEGAVAGQPLVASPFPSPSASHTWQVVRTEIRQAPPVPFAVQLNGLNQAVTLPAFGFGSGDFTLECWVKTTAGGPLFSSRGVGSPEGFVAAINADSSLTFGLIHGIGGNFTRQVGHSKATPVLDGEWHHAAFVRRGVALEAYIDGQAFPLKPDGALPTVPIGLSPESQTQLGTAPEPPAVVTSDPGAVSLGRYFLDGAMDEIRFWKRALPDDEIAASMHQKPGRSEEGLAGYWTFDQHDARDGSGNGKNGTLLNSPAFVQSDVDVAQAGEPYLTTQAKLMQDYMAPSARNNVVRSTGVAETTAYRVVIKSKDDKSIPLACYITLWADQPVSVTFMDGTTATINADGHGYTRLTQTDGELSFAIAAAGSILAPLFKVRADFMEVDERLVIAPDRHVHGMLAGISGNQLLGKDERGHPLPDVKKGLKPAVLPPGTDPNAAAAVAQAIGHAMSATVDYSVQPARPSTRRRSLPEDAPLARPYVPRYQNVQQLTRAYDARTDAIATHFLPSNEDVVRILVPENMPNPHWMWTPATHGFTPMTKDEVATFLKGKNVKHLDPLTTFFAGRLQFATRSDQMLSAAESNLAPRSFFGSIYDAIANAVSVVVTTVETAVTDVVTAVVSVVKTVVVTVVTAAKEVFDAVLQAVEHAVDFVTAALKRVGAAITAVVDFLKSVFDWNDILLAHDVIERYLVQSRFVIKSAVDKSGAAAVTAIHNFKKDVDANLDQWIAQVSRNTLQSHANGLASESPADIQGNYVTSLVSHNAKQTDSKASTDFSAAFTTVTGNLLTSLGTACEGYIGGAPDAIRQSGLPALFTNPSTMLDNGVEILLKVFKLLVDGALGIAEAVVKAIVAAIDALLDAIYDFCSGRIVIPYVTAFYEDVVMKGNGSKLTLFSLMALGAAIPATVAWKAVSGTGAPLFSKAQRDSFLAIGGEQYNWMNLPGVAKRNPILDTDMKNRLEIGMGFASVIGFVLWGLAVTIGDALFVVEELSLFAGGRSPGPIENPKFEKPLIFFLIGGQILAFVAGFPWSTDFDQVGDRLAFAMWIMGIIPFVSNCVAVGAHTWAYPGDAALTGAYGVVFVILSVSLWIYKQSVAASVANTKQGLTNLFAGLTSADQLLRMVPNPTVKGIAVLVDALGYLAMSINALVDAALAAASYGHETASAIPPVAG